MDINLILDFFQSKELSVPLAQVGILIALTSLCLLMARYKLGLLISYVFVFYWGFIFNRVYFINALGDTLVGLYIYAGLGLLMLVMAVAGFLQHD